MKLPFDHILSRRLVSQLRDVFPHSRHVTALGLDTVSDRDVWQYARDHGYCIVSKDSDFRQLAVLYGPPPKVLWLQVGNATTARVLRVILQHRDDIATFDESEDAALLVIPRL